MTIHQPNKPSSSSSSRAAVVGASGCSISLPGVGGRQRNFIKKGKKMSTLLSTKQPWIKRYCALDGNEFLCEVDREFIVDKFNLTGLEEEVHYYKEALEIILDVLDEETLDSLLVDDSSEDDEEDASRYEYNYKIQILSSAETLYGLIHARYILTDPGLAKMKTKYTASQFGRCTRYYCEKAAMLPIGLHDEPEQQSVRLYCPRCMDIYVPHLSISSKYISIDGAFFGTNFPHMFFMVYPEARPPKPKEQFVEKLYGYKIHPSAYEYQQNVSIAANTAKQCPMLLKGHFTIGHHSLVGSTSKSTQDVEMDCVQQQANQLNGHKATNGLLGNVNVLDNQDDDDEKVDLGQLTAAKIFGF